MVNTVYYYKKYMYMESIVRIICILTSRYEGFSDGHSKRTRLFSVVVFY